MELFPTTDLSIEPESPVTGEMLEKWRSYLNAFPLPDHLTPTGGRPLANVSDEALLNCPPQLIAHIQRTASQGGYQVISPRQTPFSTMMVRREGTERLLGDHEVGSIADPNAEWPTLYGDDLSLLLPDEPMALPTEEITVRPKTKTTAVAKGHEEMTDPVLACLIKGRAVIDLLRRDDVSGGSDEMADLIATAWGIEVDELMELEAYSLGIEGDLHRHAIRSDEVYPTLYAPVHVRSVITAGVADLDKSLLPPYTAMDWRRMRVFCECVFYNSCTTESLPIKKMRTATVPGTRGEGRSRANMLVFGPAPAIAWSYAPETFCIIPSGALTSTVKPGIPSDVRDALQGYLAEVRPVSHLLAKGKRLSTWSSAVVDFDPHTGETLSDNYARVTRTMSTKPVRGRTATTAARNAIFEALKGMKLTVRTRLVRYLEIGTAEVKDHLGLTVPPDSMVHELARRFATLGVTLREKMLHEAERRGHTIEDWWEDILAQVPDEYQNMKEGNFGWCKVCIWLMFKEPTDRWHSLNHANKMRALSDAAIRSVGSVALPPEKGSIDRLVEACRHATREIAAAFSGYYQGVADVGYAVSKAALEHGRPTTAGVLREGAHLWNVRARALSAINAHPWPHDEQLKSQNHIRVSAEPVDIVMKPAPYMAYKAWMIHVEKSTVISRNAKQMIREAASPPQMVEGSQSYIAKKSDVFSRMARPIIPFKESTITRYITQPARLGADLEKAWKELANDMKTVIKTYAKEADKVLYRKETKTVEVAAEDILRDFVEPVLKRARTEHVGPRGGALRDFWEVFCEGDQDISDGIMDAISRLPPEYEHIFYEGDFEDQAHIIETLDRIENEVAETSRLARETVR